MVRSEIYCYLNLLALSVSLDDDAFGIFPRVNEFRVLLILWVPTQSALPVVFVPLLSSQVDVLRGSSRFPPPRTSAGKFLSHCSQIFAGAHVQIIGELIGAVEVKVLTTWLCLG